MEPNIIIEERITDPKTEVKSNIYNFIQKARKVHGNLYDYSKVNYINSKTNVIIIDPEHGEFLQTPNNHLRGQNSPNRAKIIKSKKKTLTTTEFIKRAKEIHGNLYDYSKVNYINYNTKILIIDSEFGEFLQTPSDHLNGCGNQKRSQKNRSIFNSSNTEEFIEKARKVHGDLYDYSKVEYTNTRTKIIIIDPEFGEFKQEPRAHISGQGCPLRKRNIIKEIDHIIPLSLLCRSRDRSFFRKSNNLYKLFNSKYNLRLLKKEDNRNKKDKIILFGTEIRGRDYRNNEELIRYLFKREHNINLCDYKNNHNKY